MPAKACLVAVGGYGRQALFPYSDVDVLLLLPDDMSPQDARLLSASLAVAGTRGWKSAPVFAIFKNAC